MWGDRGGVQVAVLATRASNAAATKNVAFQTHRSLLLEIATESPDRAAAAMAIGTLGQSAQILGKQRVAEVLGAWIESEYPDEPLARSLIRPVHERLSIGDRMPTMTLESVHPGGDSMSVSFRDHTLTLVEFWTTWTPGYARDLETQRAAVSEYGEQGFHVVSIAMDRERDTIQRFLGDDEALWTTGHLPNAFESAYAQRLEIRHVPTRFLVDQSGRIVARGDDIKGERLLQRLNSLLNDD